MIQHFSSARPRRRRVISLTAAVLTGAILASCTKTVAPSGKPLIAVSILPQTWFVNRIAGDRVETVTLVGSGQDPHSWEPSPRQMELFNRADAWILSGTDFERALVSRVQRQNPSLKIVDGTEGVTFRTLENHAHAGEGEKNGGDHEEPAGSLELDRHTWLGREPAKILAGQVAKTLAELDPANAATYEANLASARAEIDSAYDRLGADLADLAGTRVFVYHPSFGYFLDEFGITQEAVETGGKEPTARHLAELIDEARAERPAAIFVQAQFPASAAKTVADAIGAAVIPLDPLAPDWLDNVARIGETLKGANR